LTRIEGGMRNLAEAIHELLERGKVTTELGPMIKMEEPPPAPAPAKAATPPVAAAKAPTAPAAMVKTPAAPAATPAPMPAAAKTTPGAPARASAPKSPATAALTPPAAPAPAPVTRPAPTRTPPAPQPTTSQAATTRPTARQSQESLKGNAQSMPLLSVFQFLGRMRKQGTMHVRANSEQIAFDLVNGSITATSTDRCPREERLGELLVELGHCTREQVDAVAQRGDNGGFERFGELAVEMGFARAEHIAEALQAQVRARFARACKTPDTAYEFVEGASQAAAAIFRFPPVAIA
jgi:hypothetical protein